MNTPQSSQSPGGLGEREMRAALRTRLSNSIAWVDRGVRLGDMVGSADFCSMVQVIDALAAAERKIAGMDQSWQHSHDLGLYHQERAETLRGLVVEMLDLSDNWPGVAYSYDLEQRARAAAAMASERGRGCVTLRDLSQPSGSTTNA